MATISTLESFTQVGLGLTGPLKPNILTGLIFADSVAVARMLGHAYMSGSG
jgi:hypothetical protein